jgi:hypothetical protein
MQDYSLYFELKELPPSLNKIFTMTWRKRKGVYDSIKKLAHYQILGKKPSKPLLKYAITFTRHTIRPLDIDNLVASFKPVLDSLVISEVIQDDKWGMTDNVFYKQEKVSKKINQKISVEVKRV